MTADIFISLLHFALAKIAHGTIRTTVAICCTQVVEADADAHTLQRSPRRAMHFYAMHTNTGILPDFMGSDEATPEGRCPMLAAHISLRAAKCTPSLLPHSDIFWGAEHGAAISARAAKLSALTTFCSSMMADEMTINFFLICRREQTYSRI